MNDMTSTGLRSVGVSMPLREYAETRWYAAYTCANHEKRIAEQLHVRGVEFFLPLYDTVRRWKDRRVRMQFPLFPGYIFVHTPLGHQLRILQVPGVVRLVGFGSIPTPLPDEQIESLRYALVQKVGTTPHPYLTVGRHVRIISGSLAGLTGILLRNKSSYRVVLSLELIMRSVAVEVDVADIEPIS
jgi:transcription antitermination factor NusG